MKRGDFMRYDLVQDKNGNWVPVENKKKDDYYKEWIRNLQLIK